MSEKYRTKFDKNREFNAGHDGMPKQRSKREILEAEQEFYERVWYSRYACDPFPLPYADKLKEKFKDWPEALKADTEMDEYERGFLLGKLSAIRWVTGYYWDMLDS